jgi:hypothetical protein
MRYSRPTLRAPGKMPCLTQRCTVVGVTCSSLAILVAVKNAFMVESVVYNVAIVGNVSIIAFAAIIATVDNSGFGIRSGWDIMDERTNVRTNVRTVPTMIAIIHASKLHRALPPGVRMPTDRFFVCHADRNGRVIITGLSQYLPHVQSRDVKSRHMRRADTAKGTRSRTV